MRPSPILLVDIDGLRPDVFQQALRTGQIPNLARLFGGDDLRRGLLVPAVATAPSITFTSQASLITGAHPSQHGIPGSQFFDRFGQLSNGTPRHYAFDVGDMLAVDDAVRVFTDGLASSCLQAETFFERMARRGRTSVCVGHMYARGAEWLPPSVVKLGRLTKGGELFGIAADKFDRDMLRPGLERVAKKGMPDVLLVYFLGLDTQSHKHGLGGQLPYLVGVVDPLVGELWDVVQAQLSPGASPLCAVFSDHGHKAVPAEDRFSLRMGFPSEREIGPLFDSLGLDVFDFPGEDPHMEALVAPNGGLAHIYLKARGGKWRDRPQLESDILPVASAFWEAHASGAHAPDLHGALAGILVRNIEQDGWAAGYQAFTPDGMQVPLQEWFGQQPSTHYLDPVARLENLAGPLAGDLLLLSNYAEGYYFGGATHGIHGGLHPEDSYATLAYGCPAASADEWQAVQDRIQAAVAGRCQAEGERLPSTADLVVGLEAALQLS
jgi:hypothetical protein